MNTTDTDTTMTDTETTPTDTTTATRPSYSEALKGTGLAPVDDPLAGFDAVQAADERTPLPRGVYTCVPVRGNMRTVNSGNHGYEVEFKVTDGPHAGRRLWKIWFLTPAAMPYSKRDLAKLGLDTTAKLKAGLEPGRHEVKLTVVVRTGDDGIERNEVRSIEFVRHLQPEANPFPLTPAAGGGVQ